MLSTLNLGEWLNILFLILGSGGKRLNLVADAAKIPDIPSRDQKGFILKANAKTNLKNNAAKTGLPDSPYLRKQQKYTKTY